MAKESKGITISESLAQVADRMKDHMEAQKAQRSAYAASAHSQKNPPNFNQTCKGWAKKDGWSLREAANLLSRCNPDRPHDLEGQKSLNTEVEKLYQFMLSQANQGLVLLKPDAFKRNYKVSPLMLLKWAADQDIEIPSEVFVPIIATISAKVARPADAGSSGNTASNSGTSPAQASAHSTQLLKVQQAAIEKFWLNRDEDRPPSSEEVVAWIRSEYKTSERAAESIDLIIRADDRKRGGLIGRKSKAKGGTQRIYKNPK